MKCYPYFNADFVSVTNILYTFAVANRKEGMDIGNVLPAFRILCKKILG